MKNTGNNSFIKSHPGISAIAACAMIAAPVIGLNSFAMFSNAAELAEEPEISAAANLDGEQENGVVCVTDVVVASAAPSAIESNDSVFAGGIAEVKEEKSVSFMASGAGHIEPVSNCLIDGATGTIWFSNPEQDAQFRLVADVEGAFGTIMNGDVHIDAPDAIATLSAGAPYDLNITFVVPDNANNDNGVCEEGNWEDYGSDNGWQAEGEPAVFDDGQQWDYEPVYEDVSYQPAPAPVEDVPVYTPAPAPAVAAHSMNAEELALANDIFNAYNDFRASRGLPWMAWDDTCANMAYGSVTGCAARAQLVHRLGIPGEVQDQYSDILQFSTWKMTGSEAVQHWQESTGHRRMMQCESARSAGVAVYKNSDGRWYYAIVYNFDGCNQSGN